MKNYIFNISIFFLLIFTFSCNQNTTAQTSQEEVQQKKKAYSNLDVKMFKKKMTVKNTVILDVRTDAEVAGGIIPGAIQMNINASDFESKIKALDKNKEYLVYCRSGRRSVRACEAMEQQGFKKLNNLLGGYNKWSTQN